MSEANTTTCDLPRARRAVAVRGGEGARRGTTPLQRHPRWPAADRVMDAEEGYARPQKRPTTGRASSVDTVSDAYASLAVARPARHGFELREDPFEEDDDREEADYAIPDVLTGVDPASHRDVLAAAEAHAHDLRKAEAELDEAINLVAVLLGSLEDAACVASGLPAGPATRLRNGSKCEETGMATGPGETKVAQVAKSSGNVFEDLGLDSSEAENLRLSSELMRELDQLIRNSGLTPAEAAELLGIQQSRVSDLIRGKIDRFSIDILVNLLSKAGRYVEMTIKQRAT